MRDAGGNGTAVLHVELRRTLLLAAGLYLLIRFVAAVAGILLLFLAVFLLAMALNPTVTWMERQRVPRPAAAALLALLFLGISAVIGWLLVPPVIEEAQSLLQSAPAYWRAAQGRVDDLLGRAPWLRERLRPSGVLGRQVLEYLANAARQAGQYTLNVVGAFAAAVIVLILATYTVAKPRPLLDGLLGALPEHYRRPARTALIRIGHQVRAWLFASVLVGAIVASAVWSGLTYLGVPNALLLAGFAFFGEFVPNIGPIVAAVPAVLLALTIGPTAALWVVLLYLVVQQVESYVLTPLILGGRLELHPVSIAFFVLVMGSLLGLAGALVAVPVAAITKILYEEFYYKPRHPDQEAIAGDSEDVLAA